MSASQHHALNELKHSRTNSILIEWHRLRILCFFTVQTRSFEVFLNFQTLLCRWLEIYLQAMTWCDFLVHRKSHQPKEGVQSLPGRLWRAAAHVILRISIHLFRYIYQSSHHCAAFTDAGKQIHGKIIFYISVDTMSMFKLNKTCNVLNTGSNSRLYDVMIINMELHQQMEHYRKRMWNARLRTRGRSFIDC